jgi:hypothetical protein
MLDNPRTFDKELNSNCKSTKVLMNLRSDKPSISISDSLPKINGTHYYKLNRYINRNIVGSQMDLRGSIERINEEAKKKRDEINKKLHKKSKTKKGINDLRRSSTKNS